MYKTGLGLQKKLVYITSYVNLMRYTLRKFFLGFDFANNFIQRLDKTSLQLILKKNGASVGLNCDIETGLIFHNCFDYSNFIIGDNCHIGKDCFFDLKDKIIIEKNVVVSMQTTFITHQDMSKSILGIIYPQNKAEILIKSNCYIGQGVTILQGVTINDSSIVGAKSLIIKDVASNVIVAGIPAKVIKQIQK